jgi:hypothetical protein
MSATVTHNTPQVTEAYRRLEKKFAFATRKAASRAGRVIRDAIREQIPPPRGAGNFPGYAATGTLRRAIVDTEPVNRPRASDWQVSVLVNEQSRARVYAHIHNVGGVIRARRAPYLKFKIDGHWVQVKQVRIKRKNYMAQGVKLAQSRMGPAIRDAFIREIR